MTELAKATLTELNASNATVGDAVAVQFNPATLRMQLSNRSSGGTQAGGPTRQRAGEGSVQLNFDLQFDTADEGSADAPVSVLRKTAAVERFVRPRGTRPGEEAPPRVQFEWGAVRLQGVMESLSLDLDLFAFDGTPLRARCAVAIKGQDAAYQYAPSGAGAGSGQATGGGSSRGAAGVAAPPGGMAASLLDTTTTMLAMAGESLAQLASRAGLDPKTWRELSSGAKNPQSLKPGQEVGLPARSGGGGGGGSSNASKGGSTSPTVDATQGGAIGRALEGLNRGGNTGPAATGGATALTRAGGVGAAQSQQRRSAHDGQAGRALAGFGLAPTAGGSATATPASTGGTSGRAGSIAGRAVDLPDDRPYGFGLPLKPRRAVAAAAISATPRARLRSVCACGGSRGGGCGCAGTR